MAANYRKYGYDFSVISDHHVYYPSLQAIDFYRDLPLEFTIIPGEEVHLPSVYGQENDVHIVNFGGLYSINSLIRRDDGELDECNSRENRTLIEDCPAQMSEEEFYRTIDAYADTVSTDDGTVLIKKIIVEGHTDTDGEHAYNQKLSLERAQNVLDYCVSLHPELKSVMTAKGCADDNPVKKADGTVDMAASRRVCFVAE